MSQKSQRRAQIRSWLLQASSEEQILITLVKDQNLSRKQARRELLIVKRNLGRDATHLDILGELMVNYHQRAIQVSHTTRKIAEGNQPASLHNTVHHLLVAQKNTILDIAKQRDLEKRNQFKPNDDPKVAADIRAEQNATNFAGMEHFARTGYFYYPGMKVCTIADCLPPEQIAKRDIIRMRFMPKSPYEDRILAEEYDAVFEEERTINKESLLNYPLEGDWYEYERVIQERSDQIGDRGTYERLARRVFIERLRNYYEHRETAEKQIDARSAEIQAYLRQKHHVRTESKFDQVLKANKEKMKKENAHLAPGDPPGATQEKPNNQNHDPQKKDVVVAGVSLYSGFPLSARMPQTEQEQRGVSPPVTPTSDTPTSLDPKPSPPTPMLDPKWRHMLCLPPLEPNDPHWKGSFASIFAPLLLTAITLWAMLNAGLNNLFTSQAQLLTNQMTSTLAITPRCHPSDSTHSEAPTRSVSEGTPDTTGGSPASNSPFPASAWQHTPLWPVSRPCHSQLFSPVSGPFPMPN